MRAHVEAAIAAAGPLRSSGGLLTRAARMWKRVFGKRPASERHGALMFYSSNEGSSFDKLLVISRGECGYRGGIRSLISEALSRGWRVAVTESSSRDSLSSARVGDDVLRATKLFPTRHVCLIGVSAGARAACNASLSVPTVGISDGYDTEPEFWMDYAKAPTLLISSRDDPVDIESGPLKNIAIVSTPRRAKCHRWTHGVALGFLESVIRSSSTSKSSA